MGVKMRVSKILKRLELERWYHYETYFDEKVFGLGCYIFLQNSIEQIIHKLSSHTYCQHLNLEQL